VTVQISLPETALAPARDVGAAHEVAPDIAYLRTAIVNLMFLGAPAAGDRGWVLVDTGITGSDAGIRDAAEARFGKNNRPAAIVMTHGHFDHAGSLETLSREWDVPVFAHRLELPYLSGQESYPPSDPKADGGIMPKLSPLFPRSPVDVSERVSALPEDGSVPFLPGWRWVHTPGHTVGHVSLWREMDGSLIAGDAFITTGQESAYEVAMQTPEMHGPPRYFTPDWVAAAASVRKLAALSPRLVVTGHGRPMAGAEMLSALQQLAREFEAIAPPEHVR
jgi:glyoxylase-like metal-dependent hydrolase (beta-lactamase superfamily II)